MGVYGSPELFPPERYSGSYGYGGQGYQNYQVKPKKHWFTFLVGFFCGIIFILLAYSFTKSYTDSAVVGTNLPSYSLPRRVPDVSNSYLISWSKAVVQKGLLYPDTAQFPDDVSKWAFKTEGNICTVSSSVTAEGQSKRLGTVPFVIKISYSDLQAEVIYLSIGDHVSYDITE